MEDEQVNEKNLVDLDRKLSAKFGLSVGSKKAGGPANNSRRSSNASHRSKNLMSENSGRSAMIRAGLNISSQERANASSYVSDRKNLASFRSKELNRSYASPKQVDEWDKLIINDVLKFEEEQKASLLKKQQMKRQVMEDLNAQMQEKRKLKRKEEELERSNDTGYLPKANAGYANSGRLAGGLDKQREYINVQDRRVREQELKNSKKSEVEKRTMETQIAEIERMKKLEKEMERELALKEKRQADKALQDELNREIRKKQENRVAYQKQYQENMQLKEIVKKQEQQKVRNENGDKKDMFGDMFEEKKHISYELAAKNQKKFDALNRILKEEHERESRIKNYSKFEEGTNAYDHKQKLSEQLKENRLKENLKNNRKVLEEQIKYKEQHERFEKDLERSEAKRMNMKAKEELDKEADRMEKHRLKRLENKEELKNQITYKANPLTTMTEQERRMNKDRLDLI